MPYGLPQGFGIITLVFVGSGQPREMITQIGYETATVPDTPFANAILGVVGDNWMPLCSTDYVLVRVEVLANLAGDFFEAESDEPGVAGSVVEDGLILNSALLVRKLTGMVGRDKVGRCYVPGLAEGSVDTAGNLFGDLVDDAPAAWNAIFDGLVALPEIVTLRLIHAPVEGEPDPTPTELVAFAVDQRLATQRRRMR